jgi:hypothetical protein
MTVTDALSTASAAHSEAINHHEIAKRNFNVALEALKGAQHGLDAAHALEVSTHDDLLKVLNARRKSRRA